MSLIEIYLKSTIGYCEWLWKTITFSDGQGFWGNYFWYLTLISFVFWGFEIGLPWRKKQKTIRKDFWLDVFYMYFNFFIFYIVLFAGLSGVVGELFNRLLLFLSIENIIALHIEQTNYGIQLLVLFVVNDFLQWNVHRLLHKVPWLWKFHKVHHSVKEMGFAAHLRFHWAESILYKGLTFIPLSMIGFGVEDFFIVHVFTIAWGHFNHANINISLGPFKYVFNNPLMHLWHHSKEIPEGKSGVNFGITLSLWDYLFKTNYIPNDNSQIELGFDGDEEYPQDFIGQQIDPFKK